MKYFLAILLILTSSFAQASEFDVYGCGKNYSALIIEDKSGEVVFQKRAASYAYPASLIKLMTLYLTFEALEEKKLKFEQIITVSERGEEIAAVNKVNTMRLKQGDKISVRNAIEAVIVKSFNEAAIVLAEAVAGNEWEFVNKMNKKAAQLGMTNSSFRNSTGLHEEGQYTTAFDLARLAKAIRKDFPQYYHLFSLKKFNYLSSKYETHNHVLVSYKGAEGLKTGFTNASGFNLISAAKNGDKRLISVVLGCESVLKRDELTKKLLNDGFKELSAKAKNATIFSFLSLGFGYESGYEGEFEGEMMFGN
jgi:D-alanyl-D-alanine carboxypeptidase